MTYPVGQSGDLRPDDAGRSVRPVGHEAAPLARSLPKASYVEQSGFERERDEVLMADWFCVARLESLGQPGEYLAIDVLGESVLVVRQGDGGLRAFYNLCRHRGSRLVPRCDVASLPPGSSGGCFSGSIRCPYHGWTYALDGQLRGAPFLPGLRGQRAELSLHRVDVLTWEGFVFVRLEPPRSQEAGSSRNHEMSGVSKRLHGYAMEELRLGDRRVYEVAANWKVILENYNECYHCGPVHPELCLLVPAFRRGGDGLDWDAGIPHRDGAYSFTTSGTTDRAPFPGLSEQERRRHKGELLLPNLMLSLSSDHVAAFTLWPESATRTTVVCDFLFHPGEIAKDGFDPSDAVEFWDLVNRQDWAICEQVQDGMTSRRFDFGYLAPMEQPSADVGAYLGGRRERGVVPDSG